MASRFKKFFIKAKPKLTEGKSSAKIETFLSGYLRNSSHSVSHKKLKENECIRETEVVEEDKNTGENRRLSMRLCIPPQKRYSPELCSPCHPPEQGFCLEQKVPLLASRSTRIFERSDSSASSPQSTLAGSVDENSFESVSDVEFCKDISLLDSEMCPVSISIRTDEQSSDIDHDENHTTQDSLELDLRNKTPDNPESLMKLLSHHQIEWAAMMELDKVDPTGILRGLSSREIRWLVRETRCRTWLVGTLGPLLEEQSEVIDVESVHNLEAITAH